MDIYKVVLLNSRWMLLIFICGSPSIPSFLFYRKPDRMDINKDTESIRLNKIGLKKAVSEGSVTLADRQQTWPAVHSLA